MLSSFVMLRQSVRVACQNWSPNRPMLRTLSTWKTIPLPRQCLASFSSTPIPNSHPTFSIARRPNLLMTHLSSCFARSPKGNLIPHLHPPAKSIRCYTINHDTFWRRLKRNGYEGSMFWREMGSKGGLSVHWRRGYGRQTEGLKEKEKEDRFVSPVEQALSVEQESKMEEFFNVSEGEASAKEFKKEEHDFKNQEMAVGQENYDEYWIKFAKIAKEEGVEKAGQAIRNAIDLHQQNDLRFTEKCARYAYQLGASDVALELVDALVSTLAAMQEQAKHDTSISRARLFQLRSVIHASTKNYKLALEDNHDALALIDGEVNDRMNTGESERANKDEIRAVIHAMLGKQYTDYSVTLTDVKEFKKVCHSALSHMKSALKYNPEDIESRFGCGLVRLNMREWHAAIQEFEDVLRHDEDYAPARHQLAQAFMMIGNLKGAIAELDRFIVDQDSFIEENASRLGEAQRQIALGDAMIRLCVCHFELGDVEQSSLFADSAVSVGNGPHLPIAHHMQGKCLIAKESNKKTPDPANWQRVVDANTKALEMNGTFLNAYRDRAVAYQRLGLPDLAEADLKNYEELAKMTPWSKEFQDRENPHSTPMSSS